MNLHVFNAGKNMISLINIRMKHKIDLIIMDMEIMVFNATFTNISVISWQSVLLTEHVLHLFKLKNGNLRVNYGLQSHFQQYFSYIVANSFIGGGKQSTRRKTTDLPQVTDNL